jgi:hypothetical protein
MFALAGCGIYAALPFSYFAPVFCSGTLLFPNRVPERKKNLCRVITKSAGDIILKMKIIQVHNWYRFGSGGHMVFDAITALLERRGKRVV